MRTAQRVAAVFSLLMGILLLATWGVLFLTNQVPEMSTKPLETIFLLAAEFSTGGALIVGGYGLLSQRHWGLRMLMAAMGMLLYCTIFSIGVFAQRGVAPAVGWFVIVAALTAVCIGIVVFEGHSAS